MKVKINGYLLPVHNSGPYVIRAGSDSAIGLPNITETDFCKGL